MEFEEVDELSAPSGGEYRATIKDFLDSGFKKAKITLRFGRKAKYVASMLRGWVAEDEPVRVSQRKTTVYLIRTDVD